MLESTKNERNELSCLDWFNCYLTVNLCQQTELIKNDVRYVRYLLITQHSFIGLRMVYFQIQCTYVSKTERGE